jgi:hypothetical protein
LATTPIPIDVRALSATVESKSKKLTLDSSV